MSHFRNRPEDLAGEELIIETARTVEARDLSRNVQTSTKALNINWRVRSLANERAAPLECAPNSQMQAGTFPLRA